MGKGQSTNPTQANCFDGGKQAYDDSAVEVRTGETFSTVSSPVPTNVQACGDKSKTASTYTDGITIKIKCKKAPHLVQFIYREFIGADGKSLPSSPITTSGGSYQTTSDPANPNWNTDSASKPNPYYEGGGINRQDPDSLTTFDQPSLRPPPGGTARTTFKAYAICDGKVVREITWVREQKDGSAPTYTVSVAKASEVPEWAKKQMKANGYNEVP